MRRIVLFHVAIWGLIAFAGSGTALDGSIKIETTYVRPSAELNYCRTCCHAPNGTFTVDVVSAPQPEDEWQLESEQPECLWTISPDVAGTVSGEHSRTFSVNLLDADFPKSFSVNVKVTWRLKKDLGGNDTATVEATFEFDAIKYVYSAQPTVEIDGRGDGALVDSHEGRVQISAVGCRRKDLLDMKFSTAPTSATSQNEIGSTDMVIQGADNSLVRSIPRPYWYAKSGNPPDCCYSNPAEYKISLKADGCLRHERTVDVSLPSDDLCGESTPASLVRAEVLLVHKELVHLTNKTLVKGVFVIKDFDVNYMAVSAASSQYEKKIFQEESIHRNQCERKPGYEFEDAFSVSEVKTALGVGTDETWEVLCNDDAEIENLVATYRGAVADEYFKSLVYLSANHDYREFRAKQIVGFNEAYKYHCCYARLGHKPEPVAKEPKNH